MTEAKAGDNAEEKKAAGDDFGWVGKMDAKGKTDASKEEAK